jgi:hypothetical protein
MSNKLGKSALVGKEYIIRRIWKWERLSKEPDKK